MADHDVLQQQQNHHHQQRHTSPSLLLLQQQSKVSSSEQAHELNEALVGKRKRGGTSPTTTPGAGAGVGQDVAEGGDNVRAGETTSLESGRSLKRRYGAEAGGGGGGGGGSSQCDKTGTAGELVGAQTRKRKSLETLGGSSSEQDGMSTPAPDRNSSKKRKPGGGGGGGGGEEVNGVDPAEASDEGTALQGPALRLRFTRRGNAFAVTKKGPAEGMAVEGARNGADDDEGGETHDVHVLGEGHRHKGSSEPGPSKRSGMEGEPSNSDSPFAQGRLQRQPSASAAADGTTHSLPAKSPESRQPLTREIYRIPSHAGWFTWTKIHNIERRTLSEFFDGKSMSKTPKIYKDYRDFIINKYRENMQRTLTFTEVRRMLIGDVNALRRVFDFLDHWGLINHHVVQEAHDKAPDIQTVVEPIPSGVRVALGPVVTPTAAPGRSSQPDALGVALGVASGVSGVQPETLSTYKNAFIPALKDGVSSNAPAPGKSVPRYTCNSCGGDCTKLLFHCRDDLQADFNLCPDCFRNGKYGAGMVARDFTRVVAETEIPGDQWTTKETLSLLEAIMRFGDNWTQVADHVGSRSRIDCIERFIQLPFGDRFLSDVGASEPVSEIEETSTTTSIGHTDQLLTRKSAPSGDHVVNASVSPVIVEQVNMDVNGTDSAVKSIESAVLEDPSPFSDASNPILAQVAFMSAMVGPRVAAAAAQAAIMAIAEEEPAVANLPLPNGHTLQSAVLKEGFTAGRQHTESLRESFRPETRHQGVLSQQGLNQLPVEKDDDGVPAVAQMKAGIGVALGVAAANAKLLADQEEREMEHLMSDIIENQMKRLYAKLEHFEELEMLVEKERVQLEQARQLLYAHHIQFAESRFYLNRERHGS